MMVHDDILASLVPDKMWCEVHEGQDACDVLVQMEDGTVYTALFVTFSYLRRQMDLTQAVTENLPESTPVRYAALDTPHILVEDLERDTLEDTIDNLLVQDVFEGLFTRVTETQTETRTTSDGKRATQEVASVVISDVLVVDE